MALVIFLQEYARIANARLLGGAVSWGSSRRSRLTMIAATLTTRLAQAGIENHRHLPLRSLFCPIISNGCGHRSSTVVEIAAGRPGRTNIVRLIVTAGSGQWRGDQILSRFGWTLPRILACCPRLPPIWSV